MIPFHGLIDGTVITYVEIDDSGVSTDVNNNFGHYIDARINSFDDSSAAVDFIGVSISENENLIDCYNGIYRACTFTGEIDVSGDLTCEFDLSILLIQFMISRILLNLLW